MGVPAYTLTRDDVITIWDANQSIDELADIFDVSKNTITQIRSGELYRNITKDLISCDVGVQHYYPQKANNARLTEEQALYVLTSGKPVGELCNMFNVARTVIYDIRRRRTWKHLAFVHQRQHRKLRAFKTPRKEAYYQLTEEDVKQIISLFPTHTNVQLAKQFNVANSTISSIRIGKNWKKLTGGKLQPGTMLNKVKKHE